MNLSNQTHNNFGLSPEALAVVVNTLHGHEEIREAKIFGSRALGTYKPASDIDISLSGTITIDTLSQVKAQIENASLFPYLVDVVDYEGISIPSLKEHIDRVGIVVFQR